MESLEGWHLESRAKSSRRGDVGGGEHAHSMKSGRLQAGSHEQHFHGRTLRWFFSWSLGIGGSCSITRYHGSDILYSDYTSSVVSCLRVISKAATPAAALWNQRRCIASFSPFNMSYRSRDNRHDGRQSHQKPNRPSTLGPAVSVVSVGFWFTAAASRFSWAAKLPLRLESTSLVCLFAIHFILNRFLSPFHAFTLVVRA